MSTPELIFAIANNGVLPFWGLLIFLPRWRGTRLAVHSVVPGLLLGGLYGVVLLVAQPGPAGGGFGSLPEVAILFSKPEVLLAGWIHYLAFDLFVGSWIARDAQRQGIHHALVVPCLILTLMLGPLGWFAYALLRWAVRRSFFLEPAAARAE